MVHSLGFKDSATTSTFWQVQATIIAQLCSLHNLQLVIAIIIHDHDGRYIKSFTHTLKAAGWCISTFDNVSFMSIGDLVAGSCNLLFGVHSLCTTQVKPFELKPSPPLPPLPLGAFLWEPFNRPEHSVSLACDDDNFCRQDVEFTATMLLGDIPLPPGVTIKYFLCGHGSDESSLCGAAVVSVGGMCPPLDAGTNQNMFQHLFDIEFHFRGHTHVCRILPFEFAWCFGFVDNLTYCLSHPSCKFALDAVVPGHTLAWILEQIMPIWFSCGIRTARFFCPINGLPPWLPSNLL